MQNDNTSTPPIDQSKVDAFVAELGHTQFRVAAYIMDNIVTVRQVEKGLCGGSFPNAITMPNHAFTKDYSYDVATSLMRKAQDAGLNAELVTNPRGAQCARDYGISTTPWALMFSGQESADALRAAGIEVRQRKLPGSAQYTRER